jgi:hypothetical protein
VVAVVIVPLVQLLTAQVTEMVVVVPHQQLQHQVSIMQAVVAVVQNFLLAVQMSQAQVAQAAVVVVTDQQVQLILAMARLVLLIAAAVVAVVLMVTAAAAALAAVMVDQVLSLFAIQILLLT